MKVNSIQFFNLTNGYNKENRISKNPINTQFRNNAYASDCFIKSDSIPFKGAKVCANYHFEQKFTKSFFKKLLREGVVDVYSPIELIPREAYDELKKYGELRKRSSSAIKALKPFKDSMFDEEKKIFAMLELLSKKHPNLTLQELLKLKFPKAEETLIRQQSILLDKMNLMIRALPRNEYSQMRKFIQLQFEKIFEQDPAPEDRFSRKKFIYELKQQKISDESIREKLYAVAEKLPQSSNSINAFIVKYSQPYKLKYYNADTYRKVPRDSQEIGLRLLEPSLGTDDHIHPQSVFEDEEVARRNGDEKAQKLSTLRVTALASRKYNELKTDTPIDVFITNINPQIVEHVQNHFNNLIEIALRWFKDGRHADVLTLCDYIIVLKNEFESRSDLVKVELNGFEEKMQKIKDYILKTKEKKVKK